MNKKRLIITSLISIILVSILFIGNTYSIFTTSEIDENANVYTTGNLDISYTLSDDNIKITDITPIRKENYEYLKPYRITVKNNGNIAYKFNLILNNTTASKTIDSNYIMTQVGINEPVTLSACKDNIIKNDIVVAANSQVEIDVRVFIAENIPNTEIGKNFTATLTIDGFAIYNNEEIKNTNLLANYKDSSSLIKALYNEDNNITKINIGNLNDNQSIGLNKAKGIMLDNNGNYRYYGKNPNNYVKFNNELWRIISISDIDNGTGTVEKRIKLIKKDNLISSTFDNKTEKLGTSITNLGSNNWTDSRLMMLLNPNYEEPSNIYSYKGSLYWNSQKGSCYIKDYQGEEQCNFEKNGLKDESKALIEEAVYYLGGFNDIAGMYANDFYKSERTTESKEEKTSTWTGTIGLMYLSDYAYASDLSICKKEVTNYYTDPNCKDTNWLIDTNDNQWTITPNISTPNNILSISKIGAISNRNVPSAANVYPVVYLKSNVIIESGQGTPENPFVLTQH